MVFYHYKVVYLEKAVKWLLFFFDMLILVRLFSVSYFFVCASSYVYKYVFTKPLHSTMGKDVTQDDFFFKD